MKYFFLLLFCPFLSIAQPPKGATTIIIKGASFSECVSQLIVKGFIIDRLDSTYKVISTKPKLAKKSASDISLQLSEKDSSLFITGIMNPKITVNTGLFSQGGASAVPIQFKGMKGSEMKLCWNAMEDFAKSFEKEVEYRID